MSRGETASIFEALYGENPLRHRGNFPPHWGDQPDHVGTPVCRAWIDVHARQDAAAQGDPCAALAVLADAKVRALNIERAALIEQRRDTYVPANPQAANLASLARLRRCP